MFRTGNFLAGWYIDHLLSLLFNYSVLTFYAMYVTSTFNNALSSKILLYKMFHLILFTSLIVAKQLNYCSAVWIMIGQQTLYNCVAYRLGSKWREKRSAVGKQLALANVYGYVPGFNRVTDRLIRNIKLKQDREGYVMDMEELVTYWSLEGSLSYNLSC